MTTPAFFRERLPTPTGPMSIVTDGNGVLRALDWDDHEDRMLKLLRRYYGAGAVRLTDAHASSATRQALMDYFDGDLAALEGVPAETSGTPFQRLVWQALRHIPVGRTVSYAALAASIGRPEAVRAVGLANGANPISIAVPCHRVIGTNNALTGYGGGIERKRWLLAHEGALLDLNASAKQDGGALGLSAGGA